jgi:hypothetical protein
VWCLASIDLGTLPQKASMYLSYTPSSPISVANHALKIVGETCMFVRLDIFDHFQARVLDAIEKILELSLSFRWKGSSFSAPSLKNETHILLVLFVRSFLPALGIIIRSLKLMSLTNKIEPRFFLIHWLHTTGTKHVLEQFLDCRRRFAVLLCLELLLGCRLCLEI